MLATSWGWKRVLITVKKDFIKYTQWRTNILECSCGDLTLFYAAALGFE